MEAKVCIYAKLSYSFYEAIAFTLYLTGIEPIKRDSVLVVQIQTELILNRPIN